MYSFFLVPLDSVAQKQKVLREALSATTTTTATTTITAAAAATTTTR